jgi:hypothetical protein
MEASARTMGHSEGKTQWLVLAAMFVGTAVGVYLLAEHTGSRTVRCSAQAEIVHDMVSPQGTALAAGSAQPGIEEEILAPENVEAAMVRLGMTGRTSDPEGQRRTPRAAERLDGQLRVERLPGQRGRLAVAVVYCGPSNPQQAVQLVNVLADQYVTSRRQQVRRSGQSACREAQEAARRAEARAAEAESRLLAFLDRHFNGLNRRASELARYEAAAARQQNRQEGPAAEAARPQPEVRTNARWLEVHRELVGLIHLRENLLAERTTEHPAVRDAEMQIQRLQTELESIPQHVLEPEPGTEPRHGSGPQSSQAAEGVPLDGDRSRRRPAASEPGGSEKPDPLPADQLLAAVARFAELQQTFLKTRGEYHRLVEAERQAREQLREPSGIEVRWAEEAVVAAPGGNRTQTLMLSLTTAVAATIGLGLIGAGTAAPLVLKTTAELEDAVGVPVVGTLPAPPGGNTSRSRPPRPWTLGRFGLVAGGAGILGVCVAAVARYLGIF